MFGRDIWVKKCASTGPNNSYLYYPLVTKAHFLGQDAQTHM
jgi:hypothetical protein